MSERTVVPINWPVNPWPMHAILAAIPFIGLAAFAVTIPFVPRLSVNVGPLEALVAALVAGGFAAKFIHRILRARTLSHAQIRRTAHPEQAADLLAVTIEIYLRHRRVYDIAGFLSRRRIGWGTYSSHLASAFLEPPRTVVDQRISDRFHADKSLPGYFLEAEEVPVIGREQIYALLAFIAIIMGLGASALGWWPQVSRLGWLGLAAILGVMAVLVVIPLHRFVLSTGRGFGRPLAVLASPGVLDDQRGRRWVAGEATMFVCMRGPHVHALVIGPAGQVAFTFENESSGDLLALWQRWNHPHPRPELVM